MTTPSQTLVERLAEEIDGLESHNISFSEATLKLLRELLSEITRLEACVADLRLFQQRIPNAELNKFVSLTALSAFDQARKKV